MSTPLRRCWSWVDTRIRQLRGRPLFITFRSLLLRLPSTPVDINCLYLLEYVGIPPDHPSFRRGPAEVRDATLQDLDALTKCQNQPREFRNRFNSNDHCAVAVVGDRIVGYEWFCDRPLYIEERYLYKIAVPSDAVYAYDAFILPEHRLSGIWLKFKAPYLRALMQRLHRHRIIGMVDYGNCVSMNTLLRFGFRPFRVVFTIKVFGRAICLGRSWRALPRWISSKGSVAVDVGRDATASRSLVRQ
jgi:hypothetical protein